MEGACTTEIGRCVQVGMLGYGKDEEQLQGSAKKFSPGSESGRLKCSAAVFVSAVLRNIFGT